MPPLLPQLIALSLLVTEPLPPPAKATLSFTPRIKFAVTDWSAIMVMKQGPVPEHAPLQPANKEFASGVGVRTTPAVLK